MSENNGNNDQGVNEQSEAPSRRSSRQRRAPKPLYVPDENIRLEDDESVDSDWDNGSEGGISIRSDDEISDEEFVSNTHNANRDKEEYDMTDGFVVPDGYEDTDEESYEDELDSEDEEELDSEDETDSGDDDDEEELDSEDDDSEISESDLPENEDELLSSDDSDSMEIDEPVIESSS